MNSDLLTPLEEQRLAELRHFVAARAQDAAPGWQHALSGQFRRRSIRAGVALVVTAAAAAVAVLAASGGHQAIHPENVQLDGYRIHFAADGIVTIDLLDNPNLAQLSARLQADGIRAMVVDIPYGQICEEPQAKLVPGPSTYNVKKGSVYSLPGNIPGRQGGYQMQINPANLKPGESLIFGRTATQLYRVNPNRSLTPVSGGSGSGWATLLVTGTLSPCQFVPAPPEALPSGFPSLSPGTKFAMFGQETSWFVIGNRRA
jgi:hypothetical protein